MASSLLNSIPLSSSSSLCAPHTSSPFRAFPESISHFHQNRNNFSVKADTLDFSGAFFEGGFGSGDDPVTPGTGFTAVEEKEEPQCPPGLRQYETMVVLRPDMSEDERLALTQKYEEVKFLTFSLLSLTYTDTHTSTPVVILSIVLFMNLFVMMVLSGFGSSGYTALCFNLKLDDE